MTELCPEVKHFHVVFEQKGSFKRSHKTIIATDPIEAMRHFLIGLPANWHGGISVFDDQVGHEDEMPIFHVYK